MTVELEHGEAIVVMREPASCIVRVKVVEARSHVGHEAGLQAVRDWMLGQPELTFASVRTFVRTMDGWIGPLQIHAKRVVKAQISTTGRGVDEAQADALEAEVDALGGPP